MNNDNKSKRYYYLKIKDTFLTSDTIDFLISQDAGNGFVYEVLYQCLCFKTLNTGGRLERVINEVIIPYDIEKLRRDLRWFTIAQLTRGLSLFAELGLVYKDENGTLVVAGLKEMVGSETGGAIDKRRHDFRVSLKTLGATDEEVNLYLENNPNGIYDEIYKVYQEIKVKRLEFKDDSKEPKDQTPYQSSNTLDQCLTNDRPTVCTVVPLIGFLFDHGYLNGFDLEDEDEKDRFRNLCFDLENKYGTRNVHISAKYFVATYCSRTYKNGMFTGWKLSTVREINSKYALFETAMRSNCEKFKDGFKGSDWDSFTLDAPSTEEEYEKALEKLGVDPKEMVADADK